MIRAYPNRPIVGLGVVVLRSAAVLLVRRAKPPNAGAWSLPGGAQELGETAEEGARRELLEETGVTTGALTLVAHADVIEHDSGRVRFHYTILDFAGTWLSGVPVAGDDVSDATWAPLAALAVYNLTSKTRQVIDAAVSFAAGMATPAD